jgi:hypothetical protein
VGLPKKRPSRVLPKKRAKATRTPIPRNATYRLEFVRCGRCPELHGPYWYAYWKDAGKLRKMYVGKTRRRATTRKP